MSDDNYGNLSYSQYMSEGKAYLTITLDLNDPVEIGDFAALFSGIGGQFDAYLKENHPDFLNVAFNPIVIVRLVSL